MMSLHMSCLDDQRRSIGLHQHLQHRLGDAAQEVAIAALRQQLGQWQSLLGHRVLGRSGVGASQLHPSRQVRWPPQPYTPVETGISTTSADATYNRLEVIEEVEPYRWRNRVYRRWLCACVSGAETIVRADHLKSGSIRSCRCLLREVSRERVLLHGARVHDHTTFEYDLWRTLRGRFRDQVPQTWQRKGGKGFLAFLADVGSRPSPDHRLMRIDPKRKWSVRNCHWVTSPKRIGVPRRWLTVGGRTMTLREAAQQSGIRYNTLQKRLQYGWTIERAIKP
jgi:hypothetical protein